jgi:dienelactone hydrolase
VAFFERDFAARYTAAGWRTVFLPDIYHRHIGKLTTDEGETAYLLNRMPQF